MPISKEYSIVADSTLSSSPPTMSPVVKRAARTYGRRREAEPDPYSSLTLVEPSSSYPTSIYRTGPQDIDEEIPPSSPTGRSISEPDQDDGGDADRESKYQFSWRKDLLAIDEGKFKYRPNGPLDDVDASESQDTLIDIPSSAQKGSDAFTIPTSPIQVDSGNLKGTPAEKSLSTLSSPSSQGHRPGNNVEASPPPVSGHRHKQTRHRYVYDSDSEVGPAKPRSSPSRNSPHRHSVLKAKALFSPSPPPSDDELPEAPFADSEGHQAQVLATQDIDKRTAMQTKKSHRAKRDAELPKERHRGKIKSKIKAPTKKELEETTRMSARLTAEQRVSIPKTDASKRFSLQNFFYTVAPNSLPPSDDPITQFTSPVREASTAHGSFPSPQPLDTRAPRSPHPPQHEATEPVTALSNPISDSEDFPEVSDILAEQTEKEEDERRKQALLAVKQKVLARQTRVVDSSDDELVVVPSNAIDQDMHVVAEKEAMERRARKEKHVRPSEGRKMLQRFAGIGGSRKPGTQKKSQAEHNREILRLVEMEKHEATRKKEEEWLRRGGTLKITMVPDGTGQDAQVTLALLAQRGRQATEQHQAEGDVDNQDEDGEDDDDKEWIPRELRGSASPEPDTEPGDETIPVAEDGDITMVNDDGEMPEQDQDEKENLQLKASRRTRVILQSDSEDENVEPSKVGLSESTINDENMAQPPSLPSMMHRSSVSSLSDPNEDENDKENNTRLMYDRSEDKENKAVVRHSIESRTPFVLRKGTLTDIEDEVARGLSLSPVAAGREGEGSRVSPIASKARRPFQELLPEEDPFLSPSPSFAAKLLKLSPSKPSTPSSPQPSPSLTLAPCFSERKGKDAGSSDDDAQAEGEESSVFKVPSLKPGFSQLFESGTQKQSPGKPVSALDKLRQPDTIELPLTLDVGLQPALEVDDSVRRQADSIFEKEQDYLLEAATKKLPRKPELYVNDHGFLTQTRPDVSSPEIYRMVSPSQPTSVFRGQSQRIALSQTPNLHLTQSQPNRHPLRTISLSMSDEFEIDETPESRTRLQRLKKHRSFPSSSTQMGGYQSSPSPSPSPNKRPRNAFDVLAHNAKMHKHNQEANPPLEKSEFVEAEAQESDDDEMLGFGFGKKKDEEEDGEDLDKTLHELMDDQAMDSDTEAKEKVLEKYQEHLEADDVVNEKIAKDAAEGKLRIKRRNRGLGFEDSDEESDDEDADRVRRKMYKRQRVDRDDIQALGQSEETRSFYEVYQNDFADDNQELAHLQQVDSQATMVADDDDANSDAEVVSTNGVVRQIREIRSRGQEIQTINPTDVSWMEDSHSGDELMSDVAVKEISFASRREAGKSQPRGRFGVAETMDLDQLDPPKRPDQGAQDAQARQRLQAWALGERRSGRFGTTGRSSSGAAITGHARQKTQPGGKTGKHRDTASVGRDRLATKGEKRAGPVKATKSILSGVDRTGRFEAC